MPGLEPRPERAVACDRTRLREGNHGQRQRGCRRGAPGL